MTINAKCESEIEMKMKMSNGGKRNRETSGKYLFK